MEENKPKRKILTLNFAKSAESKGHKQEMQRTPEKKQHKKKKKLHKNKAKKALTNKGPTPAKSNQQRYQEDLSILKMLCERFPKCFQLMKEKPLKVGILEDLYQQIPPEEHSKRAIRRAIELYSSRMRYTKALIEHKHRYDLNGKVCGEVNQHQKEVAESKFDHQKKRVTQRHQEGFKLKNSDAGSVEHMGKISREWLS